MKFSVDPWDPSYGSAMEAVLDPSDVAVNVDVELPATEWQGVESRRDGVAETVLFVDGVRRIDARVWVEDDAGDVAPGVCASYAAGVVQAGTHAEVVATKVDRGVFRSSRDPGDSDEVRVGRIPTPSGRRFLARGAVGGDSERDGPMRGGDGRSRANATRPRERS